MTNKKSIHYVKFNPHHNNNLLESLIACYQSVFADEPWNEWKKCQICGAQWGINDRKNLEALNFHHCAECVIDFWPSEVVRNDIYKEIMSMSSCWLALSDLKVIGFCWGYPIQINELEKKLKLPNFANSLLSHFRNECNVAYQDEIGVLRQYRQKGIAKEMFLKRLKDFQLLGLKIGVVRTLEDNFSVPYQWYQKLGYQIIDKYDRCNDDDKRIILAKDISNFY
ncbi:GNAT family N-acetyltransferase [Candidatus Wolfebacteria bacterium]|nr:GNAT family N-acetyltransferase [Candidatus Wolfebacteria bacterium]